MGHHRAGLLPTQQPKSPADRGALQGAEKIMTSRLLSAWGLPELKHCSLPRTWGLPGHRDRVPPPTPGLLVKGSQAPPSIPWGFSEHVVMAPATADTETLASGPSGQKPGPRPSGCRTQTRQQAQGQAGL